MFVLPLLQKLKTQEQKNLTRRESPLELLFANRIAKSYFIITKFLMAKYENDKSRSCPSLFNVYQWLYAILAWKKKRELYFGNIINN